MSIWGVKDQTELELTYVRSLKWPQDALQLRWLSIQGLQAWYLSQDMRYMVFIGQDPKFKSFIFWHYTLPVKLLRSFYKIKRLIRGV